MKFPLPLKTEVFLSPEDFETSPNGTSIVILAHRGSR